jgi:nucleotide-binding universal stress UspA family protein
MKTITASGKRRASRISSRVKIDNPPQKRGQIHNVLVPIDFSPPSLEAIEFALPLLKKFDAELHLVHVFAPDYPLAAMATMPLIVPELEVGRSVRRHLKEVAKKYQIELRQENIHALKGRPFQEVCDLARDIGVDLIVISTRGNTGLKHLVIGSTAERVVRHSPCPVLVVRRRDQKKKGSSRGKFSRPALAFRKIIVPIDFSECSMKGLAYAKALAKQFGSTLILLHSVNLEYYVAGDEYARYDFPLLMRQAEKAAKEKMRDLIRKTDWEGLKAETMLEIGHAGQEICDRAKDRSADLIVTSTHGNTGLKHILLGSTAEYVVRHAHCPVLVVPSHERPVITSTQTQI